MEEKNFTKVTPEIESLAEKCKENNRISLDLYDKYEVKRGLRDLNGKGVLAGLTEISEVKSTETDENGISHPCDGKLYYRGYDVEEIIAGFTKDKRYGFEEVTYLLIFGEMPNDEQLADFTELLGYYRCIPPNFVRDIIMKKPSCDIMNAVARSVLMLYSYDDKADDVSIPNVVRQSIQLISQLPLLAVYSYQAYKHSHIGGSLIIHEPDPKMSTAENILHLLRDDGNFTPLEAEILDIALVLHAEHGGGNNSTFTTHVVTSSGTDTYSAVVSSLASLKGPKHGGANLKVVKMFEDIKHNVKNWDDEEELTKYLDAILHKEAFDKTGLIYGMGHAVYTLSDPRAVICKEFATKLAAGTEFEAELNLLKSIERLAPEVILREKGTKKDMCANVDMYSGFVYSMMGIPVDLITPLFACARMAGWAAHRFEEIVSGKRIIRPAYKTSVKPKAYLPIEER